MENGELFWSLGVARKYFDSCLFFFFLLKSLSCTRFPRETICRFT